MPMPRRDDNTLLIEDARIVYRNFAGREGMYNREGDRSFSIVLDDELADKLEADGWNVKRKEDRENPEETFNTLPVAVSFKGRPPRLILITKSNNRRTILDEDTCEMIDYAEIETVDLIIRPYDWAVNGKTGRKAYLKDLYVTLLENELDMKYADYQEANAGLPENDE